MIGFLKVSLNSMVKEIGEDKTRTILSDFSCPLNKDVEHFLHCKAIEFEKHGWAATQLIFVSYKEKPVLAGYYTLTNKFLLIQNQAVNKSLKKRLKQFATYSPEIKKYVIPAPLIGQLGKNYSNGYDKLITGDELIEMAFEDIRVTQQLLGGKIVYIECEDKQRLVEFYSSHGFVIFEKENLILMKLILTGSIFFKC